MRMNRKGYVYTVISMMLALVLLAVVSLYYDSYKSATDISPAKLRTDELHYFVESAKKDLGRAMSISARRGAAYMTDYVINNHTTLANPENTLKQVMVNGTITAGVNVPYMQDQTLNTFISSLQTAGSDLRFRTNVSLRTIDIYMYDSLHFMVVAKYNFSITDRDTAEGGVCGYENENQTLYVLVPIDGLEDPLYGLRTTNKVSRIYNHSTQGGMQTLAYAAKGGGLGGGKVYDLSEEIAGQDNDIEDYNDSSSWLVPYTVFVINTTSAALEWDDFSTESKRILNSSGGVIDYYDETLSGSGFPYVSGISGKINFSGKDYVIVRNGNSPQVLYLGMANDIVNRLYANSTNGSCFFDRLRGNANLTDTYRTQAAYAQDLLGQPNTASVGIESYVNMSDLNSSGLYPSITPYENFSSIDHLYFQEMPGRWVYGTPYWFRMDAYNFKIKNLTDYCYDDYAAVWHFDEFYSVGSDEYTYDSSRNNRPLLLYAGVASDPFGKRGSSISIGGNPGNEANADVDVSETAYTVGLWFRTQSSPPPYVVDAGIFSTDDGLTANNDRNIYLDEDGYLCADLLGPVSMETICTPETYNDENWHYAVHVFGGSVGAQKLYVDGNLRETGTLTYSNRTGQTTVRIGYSRKCTYTFLGSIDDVKIWNRALDEWELVEDYQKLL